MTERTNDYKTCLDTIYLLQELKYTVKSITGDGHNFRLYHNQEGA
jgi:hypothetical protein